MAGPGRARAEVARALADGRAGATPAGTTLSTRARVHFWITKDEGVGEGVFGAHWELLGEEGKGVELATSSRVANIFDPRAAAEDARLISVPLKRWFRSSISCLVPSLF